MQTFTHTKEGITAFYFFFKFQGLQATACKWGSPQSQNVLSKGSSLNTSFHHINQYYCFLETSGLKAWLFIEKGLINENNDNNLIQKKSPD